MFQRDIIPFMQLFGTTTFDNGVVAAPGDGIPPIGPDLVIPDIPTARTSSLITAGSQSAAWAMFSGQAMSIELDSEDRGGGILQTTYFFERTVIVGSFKNPLAAGVKWTAVPAAEMGLDIIAAENVQVQEFSVMVSGAYRLNNTDHLVNGDLWAAMKVVRV